MQVFVITLEIDFEAHRTLMCLFLRNLIDNINFADVVTTGPFVLDLHPGGLNDLA